MGNSIRRRITAGFGFLLVLLVSAAAYGWHSSGTIREHVTTFQQIGDQAAALLSVQSAFGDLEVQVLRAWASGGLAQADTTDSFTRVADALAGAQAAFPNESSARAELESIAGSLGTLQGELATRSSSGPLQGTDFEILSGQVTAFLAPLDEIGQSIADREATLSAATTDLISDSYFNLKLMLLATLIVGAAWALTMGRSVLRPLHHLKMYSDSLNSGIPAAPPQLHGLVELDELANSLKSGADERIEADRARAAMEASSALVMLADADHNIVYLNQTLYDVFRERETEIKQDLPRFDVAGLIGCNIDIFHRNPAHQRAMLGAMEREDSRTAKITVGGITFGLTVKMVTDRTGARIGTVVEWRDLTEEIYLQNQIAAVVTAAAEGDFSQRADMTLARGIIREICGSINEMAASVDHSISACNTALAQVASGDLTTSMQGKYRGVFADLQSNLNTMVHQLSDAVGQISSTAAEIGDSTRGIASGAEELASAAESQAASIEEISATMEEMTSTVRENSSSADNAHKLASGAAQRAENGGAIVKNAIDAMTRISQGSEKISDIVSVIDGIAFQTNLLALNAAVEAARAGDAGKGFAVVASEVRTLAQRSAEAAKDIARLIADSTGEVSQGVSLVNETGGALQALVESVNDVASSIAEISSASREQAAAVDEVSAAIAHMDKITQRNATLADRSATTARDFVARGSELSDVVGRFDLGGGGAHSPTGEIALKQSA